MRFPRRWYPVVVAWNTVGFTTAKVYINPRNRAAKLCGVRKVLQGTLKMPL